MYRHYRLNTVFLTAFLFGMALVSPASIVLNMELVKEHTNGELSGLKTYRLYAVCENPNDQVISVYGSVGSPLSISSTEVFWQSSVGDALAYRINPGLFLAYPDLAYDSWVTIGAQDKSSEKTLFTLESPAQPWINPFEEGKSIEINDKVGGSWFMLPGDKAKAGDSKKVLLGQFTTKGKISVLLNLQVRMANAEKPTTLLGLRASAGV